MMVKYERTFNGKKFTMVGVSRAPAVGRYKTRSEARKAGSSFPNRMKRIVPKKSGGKTFGFNLYVGPKK